MSQAKHLSFSKLSVCGLIVVSAFIGGCGKGSGTQGNFPADFNRLSDAEKVAYVMQHATPDSVARFVCDASLGKVEGVKIDTFANATLYVYENYKSADQAAFASEYDRYIDAKSLADRMRLYALAGEHDPQGLGYALGLDYLRSIRDKNMTADQVEAELKEFKKACGADTDTYRRFIVGFHTVLELDHGKDLSEEIYRRFKNYE